MWIFRGWRLLPLVCLLLAPALAPAQQLALPHDLLGREPAPPEAASLATPERLAQRDTFSGSEVGERRGTPSLTPEIRNYVPLYTLTEEGSFQVLRTPSPGKLHVHGALTLRSSDYFRGRYDGVGIINHDYEVDQLPIAPSLGVTLDLLHDRDPLRQLSLVGGSANTLGKRPADGRQSPYWYESNNYVGLVAGLGPSLLAGLTYTAYLSPNDEFDSSDELAVTFQWSGTIGRSWALNPHVKAAWPLGHRGVYVEGGLAPSVNLGMLVHAPLTLSVPLVLGVGVQEYYGNGSDYTGYLKGGLVADLSLKQYIPAAYGSWHLVASVNALGREKPLRNASRRYSGGVEGADLVIVEGELGLRFTY
ncbi:MAG: hypothetical protein AB7N91_15425 [Candidatus Tectimicrobiota bacterium]